MAKSMTLAGKTLSPQNAETLLAARAEFTESAPGVEGVEMLDWFNGACDRGDMWGSVLGALFDICEHLTFRGDVVPESWGFMPGAGGVQQDPAPDLGEFSPEDLEALGELLATMRGVLADIGASY